MLRVLTLNIWGFGHPYEYAVRRGIARGAVPGSAAIGRPLSPEAAWDVRQRLIVDLIRGLSPDVVGLQEVAGCPRQFGGESTADRIADALGWERVVGLGSGGSVDDGERIGQAVLTPRPVEPLGIPFRDGEYGCLATRFRSARGHDAVFLTAHLPLDAGPSVVSERRARCATLLLAWCDALPEGQPVILAGDFNCVPGTGLVEAFVAEGFQDAGTSTSGRPIKTMPSHEPVVPLDYILVRGARVLSCDAVGDRPDAEGYYPSDHLGLTADLWVHDSDDHPDDQTQNAAPRSDAVLLPSAPF